MRKVSIILGCAHGKSTTGKQSPDGTFKEYIWSRHFVNDLLRPMLSEAGFSVTVINDGENEMGLTNQVKLINSLKFPTQNVVFASFHNNAKGAGNWENARGFAVYTSKGKTKSDEVATIAYNAVIEANLGIKIRKDEGDGDMDFEENFTVLMNKYPSILVEALFQDNKDDLALLKSEEFNKKLAKAFVVWAERLEKIY